MKRTLRYVKPVVAVLTCAWILSLADWSDILGVLPTLNAPGLTAAFVLMVLSVPFSAYKWKVLLKIHGADYPLSTLTRYYFVAGFLNNFLPSAIGGDGYRVYKTFKNERSRSAAVIAVVAERVTGLLALLILACIASFVIYAHTGDRISGFIALGGTVALGGGLLLALLTRGSAAVGKLEAWMRGYYVVNVLLEHLGDYRRDRRRSARVIGLSFLFHVHALTFYALLVFSVGGQCSIFELTVAVAAMSVAAVLPISINGLGIMDGTFVFMLVHYGVGYEHALLAMLIWRVIVTLIGAVGGIIYALGGEEPAHKLAAAAADPSLQGPPVGH